MATPRDAPYIWATWITRLMAGEVHCEWAAWFKAHHMYDKLPSAFDVTKWTAEHTALVRERAAALRADGYSVFVEGQNAFKLRGQHGITLAGKPDILALRHHAVHVIECKTGLPRQSDQIQVLIYLLVLPHVRPTWKQRTWHGSVQYRDNVVEIPGSAVDPQFRAFFRRLITQVGGTDPLPWVPSYAECRFCDISQRDCSRRIDAPPLDITPEHDLF